MEAKYEKILEEPDLMFQRKVEEVRNSLNAQMVESEVSVLKSFKRLIASVGGPAEEQECAVAELKSTISEMTEKSVSGLVESPKKLQKSSKSKDRHIRYCLRKLFGLTNEKLHDDELMDKLHARICDLLEPLFDLHYYDVVSGEYLLGDDSPVRIVNSETHKCDKHYMAHVVCLDKNAALFNVGSRVGMDRNILSLGRAFEDLELLCKDMTNAKALEGRLFRLEQMAKEKWNNGMRR